MRTTERTFSKSSDIKRYHIPRPFLENTKLFEPIADEYFEYAVVVRESGVLKPDGASLGHETYSSENAVTIVSDGYPRIEECIDRSIIPGC